MIRLAALYALLACLLMGSCSRVRESAAPSISDQHEANFEIKNFSWTNTSDSLSWRYEGKGVLVTKDPLLQKGAALVFLDYDATPKPTFGFVNGSDASGITTDGTGSISVTIHYYKDHYKEDPGTPKLEWRTLGYLRMAPAQVTALP